MSRAQTSQQIKSLLIATGYLGTGGVLETALAVESYLTAGLTFPLAMVQTLESPGSLRANGRLADVMFKVSICGEALTEDQASNFVASGGSASSAHVLENLIRDILQSMNSRHPGTFLQSTHGFQGYVNQIHQQRVVVTPGLAYIASDVDIVVTDATYGDYYHAPRHFTATAGAAHSVVLAWLNPPTRYDQYQNILRRGANPGDPAPTSYNGVGDVGITITGGVLGVAATDASPTLSGKVYNYSLFRLYNTGSNVAARAIATATTT